MSIFKKLTGQVRGKEEQETITEKDLAKLVENYNKKHSNNIASKINNNETVNADVEKVGSATTKYSGFFPDLNREYKITEPNVIIARKLIDFYEHIRSDVIGNTKLFYKGKGPTEDNNEPLYDSLEDYYKEVVFRQIIRVHLQTAFYSLPGLFSTTMAICDKENKAYLKDLIAFSSMKPLLAYAFDKLICPIAKGEEGNAVAHQFSASIPSWIRDYEMPPKDYSDQAIISNFLTVARYYQVELFILSVQTGYLKELFYNPKLALSNLPKGYDTTWVSTNLLHSIQTIKQMGGIEKMSLEEYPKQGLNLAMLILLYMHQQDNDFYEDGNSSLRYELGMISQFPEGPNQMLASQAGGVIFGTLM